MNEVKVGDVFLGSLLVDDPDVKSTSVWGGFAFMPERGVLINGVTLGSALLGSTASVHWSRTLDSGLQIKGPPRTTELLNSVLSLFYVLDI